MKGRRWRHWRPWRVVHRGKPRYQTAWRPTGLEHLDSKIDQLKAEIEHVPGEKRSELLEKLLVLQAPRAALAQAQMDANPRGYHDKHKRLYELIDFNDTFDDLVLSLPHDQLPGLADRLKMAMAQFCASEKTPMFTDEQFEAIVHGLSREVAVYLGAKAEGFQVEMTPRAVDAFGIDMVVTDPATRIALNIDCKTPSSFRHRLEELEDEGRITDAELLRADNDDFITVINREGARQIPVTIICIRPERLGDVEDFKFKNTTAFGDLLRSIVAYHDSPNFVSHP